MELANRQSGSHRKEVKGKGLVFRYDTPGYRVCAGFGYKARTNGKGSIVAGGIGMYFT